MYPMYGYLKREGERSLGLTESGKEVNPFTTPSGRDVKAPLPRPQQEVPTNFRLSEISDAEIGEAIQKLQDIDEILQETAS